MAERNGDNSIENRLMGDPLFPYLRIVSELLLEEGAKIEPNSLRENQLTAISSVFSMQIAERQELPGWKPFTHSLRSQWDDALTLLDKTVSRISPDQVSLALKAFTIHFGELAIQIDRQTSSFWTGRVVERDFRRLVNTPQAITFTMAFVK